MIPRLPSDLQERFAAHIETAMGVHFVYGQYAQYDNVAGFVVLAATYFLPILPYGPLPSLGDLRDGVDLDAVADEEPTSGFEVRQWFDGKEDDARFLMSAELRRLAFGGLTGPPPMPPPGTPLVLHTSTSGTDAFLRFSYSARDPRIHGGLVQAGSYATPYRDGVIVNSGFAAVARYALPVPFSAKYVRVLTPPAGTALRIGASGPLYGQSGGGVEAFFPASFSNITRAFTIPAY